MASSARPQNVGILGMDLYFPPSYISQTELEAHDEVSMGKYTIGLGQDTLVFCGDQEDVISMSLTVVQGLLEKYSIDPKDVGRLEVGSETVIDKSKSIKTSLMMLFESSGNSDVEGVDSTNACYGGTAALFNSLNWVESSAWDGRYAIVVAADSAVYAEGPARPTGGAGAVAMLIGPDAPLPIERSFTSSHMANVYDFYKPKLASEYPVVDGKLTQTCFLSALDSCYNGFCDKYEKGTGNSFSLADSDYVISHAPYNKLVQKSFARLMYNDFLRHGSEKSGLDEAAMEPFVGISKDESYTSRDLEKVLMQSSKKGYEEKISPSATIPKQVGNMYTASLYAGLCALVSQKSEELVGKRLLMFSYGSGLAASMFSIQAREAENPKFSIPGIAHALGVEELLASRVKVASHWRMRIPALRQQGRDPEAWDTFSEELISAYGSASPEAKAAHKLQRFRQLGTVEEYSRRFQELVAQLVTLPMSEGDKIRSFINGLSSEMQIEMAQASRGEPWTDFEHLRTTTVSLDASLRNARASVRGKGKERGSMDKGKGKASQEGSSSKFGGGKRKEGTSSRTFKAKKSKPPAGPKLSKEEKDKLFKENKCFICKKEGHKRADCPEKKSEN